MNHIDKHDASANEAVKIGFISKGYKQWDTRKKAVVLYRDVAFDELVKAIAHDDETIIENDDSSTESFSHTGRTTRMTFMNLTEVEEKEKMKQ